ncbi:LuxR family transcriptional regulator [Streptomyces sp. CoH17]|uniref:LuxR family transcriptional regulator n=1 Tax=Streptomyces sp. CoH17 TaxID=2992806 RepID=UPI00226D8FF9|nr:LuxR family transcriptional regulator [Streptomyces sp. CoH17]
MAAASGTTEADAVALLERLHHSGLVSRRPSGEFLTVDPRHAVRALVESHERQLAAVRDAVAPLAEIFDRAQHHSTTEPTTRTISGPETVGDHYYRLKQAAQEEFSTLGRPPFLLAPNAPMDEGAVGRGVRLRCVYAAASFEAEAGWRELGSLVSRGEEARVLPSVPVKMAVADRAAAMVSLDLSPDGTDSLYTEAPPLLEALTDLFEHYWDSAAPLSSPAPSRAAVPAAADGHHRPPTDDERRLLAFFAAGIKDDSIARQFGISTRTLRRRIQDLYAELGTTSRFGAGVIATRRGWI